MVDGGVDKQTGSEGEWLWGWGEVSRACDVKLLGLGRAPGFGRANRGLLHSKYGRWGTPAETHEEGTQREHTSKYRGLG